MMLTPPWRICWTTWKHPLGFDFAEAAGGLVHDEDPGVDRECLGDLNQLFLAWGKVFDQTGKRGVKLQLIAQVSAAVFNSRRLIQPRIPPKTGSRPGRYWRHIEVLCKVQFLMNQADAIGDGVTNAVEANGPPGDEN